jgi:hypothetical protein
LTLHSQCVRELLSQIVNRKTSVRLEQFQIENTFAHRPIQFVDELFVAGLLSPFEKVGRGFVGVMITGVLRINHGASGLRPDAIYTNAPAKVDSVMPRVKGQPE